jgi:hypothetical protein
MTVALRPLRCLRAEREVVVCALVQVSYSTKVNVLGEILKSLPTLLLLGFTIYFFRNMMGEIGGMAGGGAKRGGRNIFSFGKSPATLIKPGEKVNPLVSVVRSASHHSHHHSAFCVPTPLLPAQTKVMFKDVAGLDEAKVEVMEFVKFLKNPVRGMLLRDVCRCGSSPPSSVAGCDAMRCDAMRRAGKVHKTRCEDPERRSVGGSSRHG